MKAFIYDKYGSPDVMKLADIPEPVPGEGEVIVKTEYVSLNTSDYELLTGKPLFTRLFGLFRPKNRILGTDIAGTVKAAGKNAVKFSPGDRVFGDIFENFGGFAEYVSVPEKLLTEIPGEISFKTASAIPQAAEIAFQGVFYRGSIRKGEKILINGAGGGSGSFAVQIAKHFKADVTGVDSPEKQDFILSLGADRAIDYKTEDFTSSGESYDLILDLAAYHPVADYKRVLAKKGIYWMVGGSMSVILQLLFFSPFISLFSGKKMGILALKTNSNIEKLLSMVKEGIITPAIDREYSFHEIPEALRYLGDGHAKGKIVIKITGSR